MLEKKNNLKMQLKYHINEVKHVVIENEIPVLAEGHTLDYQKILNSDKELMQLLGKPGCIVVTHLPIPPEVFPDSVVYICYYNRYMIYREQSFVTIYFKPELNIDNYSYAEDKILLDALVRYEKLIYRDIKPINWLPNGVKTLCITDYRFNHPLDNLPGSLEALIFNDDVEEKLWGFIFNQPLDNLPHGLKILALHQITYYTHPFHNLPVSLEYLIIHGFHIDKIDKLEYLKSIIPNTSLLFYGGCQRTFLNHIPNKYKHVRRS